jgi:hypothetical protein
MFKIKSSSEPESQIDPLMFIVGMHRALDFWKGTWLGHAQQYFSHFNII